MALAAGAPAAAVPPASGALGSAGAQTYTDLSGDLSPAWQLVDFAVRQVDKALRNGGFYQNAEAKAGVQAWADDGKKLISAYSRADNTMGPDKQGPSVAPSGEDVEYVERPT